ncbi:MAG: alpha/beta family hydrolase [Dehalococcoidia bacterium]|nr:dienelactone hydrolase family protein [Dehalococcoidia bacterium]MDZ4278399.1 alpha/beta family hydrolase [Dehalococcoidia bacterium]
MPEENIKVALPDGGSVTAVCASPQGGQRDWLFVYAPGAGANLFEPFGRHLSQRLAVSGVTSVRFQFPYMEARRRRPDRPAVLETTWRAVIEAVRASGMRLAVGGRSMGGRIASQVVAQEVAVDAVALFAYPLHSPAKPEEWRDGHLAAIGVPTLFCSGTRDAFAKPEELRQVAGRMQHATLHLLEGADHGFGVPKSADRYREDVWEEATAALLDFLEVQVTAPGA